MQYLCVEITSIVERTHPEIGDTKTKSIVNGIKDLFSKIIPNCPPIEVVKQYVCRQLTTLPLNPSKSVIHGWVHEFRVEVSKTFQLRCSTWEEGYEIILRICRGNQDNNNHTYRAMTLLYRLVTFGIMKQNVPAPLRKLLAEVEIKTTDNASWTNMQGACIVKMFYYSLSGIFLDFNRCIAVWEIYNGWEKVSEIPSQLAVLSFETLKTFLPPIEVVTSNEFILASWEQQNRNPSVRIFDQFPFKEIKGPFYYNNPYSEINNREFVGQKFISK